MLVFLFGTRMKAALQVAGARQLFVMLKILFGTEAGLGLSARRGKENAHRA